jgi:hypothetical protein
LFSASTVFSSLRRTSQESSSTRFGSRISRTAALFALGGGVAAAGFLGTGTAAAAPVSCVSPPSANDIRVDGTASCGATSTGPGVANAGAAESGTAVSVTDGPGATTTYANGFGTALGASKNAGNAYAWALGGGIAHSWADEGATTVAVAGWGSGATAEAAGVDCVGPLSMALNLKTGQFCMLGN